MQAIESIEALEAHYGKVSPLAFRARGRPLGLTHIGCRGRRRLR